MILAHAVRVGSSTTRTFNEHRAGVERRVCSRMPYQRKIDNLHGSHKPRKESLSCWMTESRERSAELCSYRQRFLLLWAGLAIEEIWNEEEGWLFSAGLGHAHWLRVRVLPLPVLFLNEALACRHEALASRSCSFHRHASAKFHACSSLQCRGMVNGHAHHRRDSGKSYRR